jgi:hypothetical protein
MKLTKELVPGDVLVWEYDDGTKRTETIIKVTPEPHPAVVSRLDFEAETVHPSGITTNSVGFGWAGNEAEQPVA